MAIFAHQTGIYPEQLRVDTKAQWSKNVYKETDGGNNVKLRWGLVLMHIVSAEGGLLN